MTSEMSVQQPWANRIVGHENVPPSALAPSVLNARRHPQNQSDALAGVLGELGWIQSVVASKRTGAILDGHLRVEMALRRGEPTVPVVWVDVDPAEEAYALATLDPLAALAQTDAAALAALLANVSTEDAAVQAMLDGLAQDAGVVSPDWESALDGLPDGDRGGFQQMTFTLSDEQAEQVKATMQHAKDCGPFDGTGNENSNGNALVRICEAYGG